MQGENHIESGNPSLKLSRRGFLRLALSMPFVASAVLALPKEVQAAKLAAPRITAWKPKSKAVALAWSRVSGARGYQVRFYSNVKLKKVIKTMNVSATRCTAKALKRASFYFVRVRAWKKVGGKKVYGPWSAKRVVRTAASIKVYNTESPYGTTVYSGPDDYGSYCNRYMKTCGITGWWGQGSGYNRKTKTMICAFSKGADMNNSLILLISHNGTIHKGKVKGNFWVKGKLLIK